MAPASFLQLPSSQVELSIECLVRAMKLWTIVYDDSLQDVGQPISGITVPPPRR